MVFKAVACESSRFFCYIMLMNLLLSFSCSIFALNLLLIIMKIYFDTDLYDECLTRCPMGKDCMVGSIFCEQCKYNMYTRRGLDVEHAVFAVGDKISCRSSDYVECCFEGDATFWKLIKKFFYKYIK